MYHFVNARKTTASVGMMLVFSAIGFAQCTFAVVNTQDAVVRSNEGKALAPKFDARVKEWTTKLNGIHGELSKAQKELQSLSERPPQDTVAVLNAKIRDKQNELAQMASDAQKDVDNYRDSLLGPLKKVVAQLAEMVATERGITTIVESSAILTTPLPAGVPAKDCDITAEVITRMNAKSGADTPAK
jgi:Skp family chaperone for outer membrane proteins